MFHGTGAASVPKVKESSGDSPEHRNYGADSSSEHGISLENPAAITFEIQASVDTDDEKGVNIVHVASNRASHTPGIAMEEPKRGGKFEAYCEGAVICTVIIVIWGLLTLPTIYYHMPQV